MPLRDIIICILTLVIGLALLFGASTRLDDINQQRTDMGLALETDLGNNAPPALAFATIAMGAFRGLVVDILWMRADTLKEEGKYFDAKQLAEWITVLQPRFPAVWDFHAWNMAYNISVAVPAEQWQERWRWVRNGYELIRDKGIQMNPKSITLYRSLAWIFQHKMGQVSDDCHRHYKRELALSMRPLLGENPTSEHFELMIKTPQLLEEILDDEKIAQFVTELRNADDQFKNDDKLPARYLALRHTPSGFEDEAFAVIDKYRGTVELAKFDTFAKAYQLRDVWKFDIEIMQEVNKETISSRSLKIRGVQRYLVSSLSENQTGFTPSKIPFSEPLANISLIRLRGIETISK